MTEKNYNDSRESETEKEKDFGNFYRHISPHGFPTWIRPSVGLLQILNCFVNRFWFLINLFCVYYLNLYLFTYSYFFIFEWLQYEYYFGIYFYSVFKKGLYNFLIKSWLSCFVLRFLRSAKSYIHLIDRAFNKRTFRK